MLANKFVWISVILSVLKRKYYNVEMGQLKITKYVYDDINYLCCSVFEDVWKAKLTWHLELGAFGE